MLRFITASLLVLVLSGCATITTTEDRVNQRAEDSALSELPFPIKYTWKWEF